MRVVPSHQEIQELLPAAALDVLEPAELADVMDHLRGCPACAQLLADYRDAVARLALLLPRRPSHPERARARLLARAHADGHSTGPISHGFTAGIRRAGGWMVAAALAGVVLIHHAVHRPIAYGWLAAGILSVVLVGLAMYSRIQRRRVAALEEAVAQLARQRKADGRRISEG